MSSASRGALLSKTLQSFSRETDFNKLIPKTGRRSQIAYQMAMLRQLRLPSDELPSKAPCMVTKV
jgi:hypothetical protein